MEKKIKQFRYISYLRASFSSNDKIFGVNNKKKTKKNEGSISTHISGEEFKLPVKLNNLLKKSIFLLFY